MLEIADSVRCLRGRPLLLQPVSEILTNRQASALKGRLDFINLMLRPERLLVGHSTYQLRKPDCTP